MYFNGQQVIIFAFEIDFSVAVRVKNVDDALYKRILLQFWQWHELINTQRPGLIKVELFEPLSESLYLFNINYKLQHMTAACNTLE